MKTNTISPQEAIAALEGVVSEYILNSIKSQLFKKEHEAVKDGFTKRYGGWSFWADRSGAAELRTSKTFSDRKEAMAWLDEQELGKPEFSKFAYASDKGEPKTQCTLTCKGEFEGVPFEVEANYVRPGLPTNKCHVEPHISYSVVCDLDK